MQRHEHYLPPVIALACIAALILGLFAFERDVTRALEARPPDRTQTAPNRTRIEDHRAWIDSMRAQNEMIRADIEAYRDSIAWALERNARIKADIEFQKRRIALYDSILTARRQDHD